MNLLLIAVLALIAIVLGAVALWQGRVLRRRLVSLAEMVDENRQRLRALATGAAGQNRDLARARQDLEHLRSRLERVASGDGADPVYDQAIRMARKGLAAQEIMDTCGLSRMEADLVVLVHQGEREQA